MAIKNLPTMKSIFRTSFNDNQVGIFRGRRRPEDPGDQTEVYQLDENFTTDPEYTETDSGGAGAGVSVTGGAMILDTGTVDDAWAKVVGTDTFTDAETQGSFVMEFRAKIDFDANGDFEAYIGLGENGETYADGSESMIQATFNNEENLDAGFMARKDAVGAGSEAAAWRITDNTWTTYRIEVLGSGGVQYYKDGDLLYTDTTNIPTDRDMEFVAKIYNRANPGATQRLYIDWIRVYSL